MKRKILFVLLCCVILISLFSISAFADGEDDYADGLLKDFNEIIPIESGVTTGEELMADVGFETLFSDIIAVVSGEWSSILSFFLMLMGFAVIMAVSDGVYVSDNPLLRKNVSAAVAAIASVSIFTALYGLIGTVRDSLESVVDFFSSLVPIVTAISASSGAVGTASVQAVNMNITLAVIQKFCTGALLPLVFALFSLALASSLGEGSTSSVAKGIKNAFMWGIGIICTVLAAAIALQTLLASAKDTAALRAARYAASGMIPIVGTSIASALTTLASGLAFVKSTVGVGAIAVIISLALVPLVSILLYRLAFSITIIFLEFLGSEGGVRCFSAFRTALDALLAVYSISVLICIVQLIVFIKSGVSGA